MARFGAAKEGAFDLTTGATSRAYEMWFFASLEAGLGTLMLFVPEQFASPVFAGMHDILPPLGVALLLCAALLLIVGYKDLSGRAVSLVLGVAAVPLFIVASNFVRVGAAAGIVTWGFLGLVLLWLAFPSLPAFARPWERPLVGVAGAIELLLGIVFLLPTALVGAKTIGSFAQYLGVFGPSFVIAGAAVLVFERRGLVWPRRAALALGVLNFAAVWSLSAVENAIWTGILLYGLLLLVCLAALVPEPRDLTVSQKILGLFAAMLGAIVVFTLAMTALLQGAAATASAVDRSETIVAASSELAEDVIDMQNAARGFLLIGDEELLAQYGVAHDRFVAATARLARLLAHDADGLALLGDARRSFDALDGHLEGVISLYRQDPSRALAEVRAEEGVRLLQAGRADIGRLVGHESAIREQRESASVLAAGRLRASLIGAATLVVIVGGGLALYLARTLGRRTAALRQIAQTTASASDLERPIPVTARGDDIDALARALEQMRVRLRDAFAAEQARAAEVRTLFQNTTESVLLTRADGRILDANAAALALFGWSLEELREGGREVVIDPTDEHLGPALELRRRTGRFEGQLRLRRKDGRTFTAELTTNVFRGPEGEERTSMIIRDVTERERAAAELRSAKEEADRANQAKSAFLANMSHELRTPLNAILGFSQLLEERVGASLEERQRGWLRNIQTAGTHLLDLINDVLDLSKVEAGRYEIRPEQITLADLLAPVVSTARQDAQARGLAFDVSEAPAIAVFLDPLRTRQVLHNLLSNALKFTERGGHVRLAVGVAGRDLQFVVSDTGIGISAADQGRVFGLFERLHERRHEASGTGLGLALTRRIIELHGGSISFTSEVGIGTTFTVSLPGAVHSEMVGPRVLIVEDDPRDAALMAALAAEAGLPIELAVTGATALATIRRDPPSAIVLDLRLPDMRGEAVLEALQADSATRRVPVIVVTIEDDEGRTRPLGAADHLTKPIDAARLRRWLALVTDGQRGSG